MNEFYFRTRRFNVYNCHTVFFAAPIDKMHIMCIINLKLSVIFGRWCVMKSYNTEQCRQLVSFMEKNRDKSYSVDEWIAEMKSDSTFAMIPGRSTVFRNIQKLVECGKVIRSATGRFVKYQLVECPSHAGHLHLKCTSCGELIHLSHEASEALADGVMKDSSFDVSSEQTVIYGKCGKCKGKG